MYPVPWQMKQVMLQRADSWIQRLYELCCEAYKRSGKDISVDFERAIWAYWIEPFIMGEPDSAGSGYKVSDLLELLFCAAGLPADKRNQLKVGQTDCCLNVRNEMLFSWQQKLLRLGQRLDESTGMARFGAGQFTTTHAAVEPSSQPSRFQPPAPPVPKPVPGPEQSLPAPRYSGAAKWEDVEITFLSDHRVQIRINGKLEEPANYAELGFDDGRSQNPNKAWLTLRSLAENRGVLKDGRTVGEPWPKVEKRIQEIRKVFRELFGISADPVPFVEGVGYQSFQHSLRPLFPNIEKFSTTQRGKNFRLSILPVLIQMGTVFVEKSVSLVEFSPFWGK